MQVLIADDDAVSRRMLELLLKRSGYSSVVHTNGESALQALLEENAPPIAILDWEMPGLDGIDVCRRVRVTSPDKPLYLILVTSKSGKGDTILGLQAGADDYVTKPFDPEELRARLQVGSRVVQLQRSLADRVTELESALSKVNQLQGLLPICSYCKKIRNDLNYWEQLETYFSEHSEARFSHGICPSCFDKHVRPELEEVTQGAKEQQRLRAPAPALPRNPTFVGGGAKPELESPTAQVCCGGRCGEAPADASAATSSDKPTPEENSATPPNSSRRD